MATWDDVASVVGELPLTEERSPNEWRVGKKLIAWERPLRASDHQALTAQGIEPPRGDILGVRVADEGVKFALIAAEPAVYFTTPHFDGYPAVLVRIPDLARLDRDELANLVEQAWLTRAQKRVAKAWLEAQEPADR